VVDSKDGLKEGCVDERCTAKGTDEETDGLAFFFVFLISVGANSCLLVRGNSFDDEAFRSTSKVFPFSDPDPKTPLNAWEIVAAVSLKNPARDIPESKM